MTLPKVLLVTLPKLVVKTKASAQGLFKDLADFITRVPAGIEQVSLLIRIGAFRFTGIAKQTLLWEAHHMLKGYTAKDFVTIVPSLFKGTAQQTYDYKVPLLMQSKEEEAFDQIELLGFPLCNPFELADEPLINGTTAKELPSKLGHFIIAYGYLVTVKNTKTAKDERMNFATFLDQNGDYLDSIHFPIVAQQFPFQGRGLYKLHGRVAEEFGFYSVEVSALYKVAMIPDPRYEDTIAHPKGNYSKTLRRWKKGQNQGG